MPSSVWYARPDFGAHASEFEVLPDGYAEIVFYFGGPCSLATAEGLQLLPSPFLVGLLQQSALFHTHNQLEIIGIRCFPWTVFEVLGLPPGPAGVRIVEHPIAQLQAPLAEAMRAGRLAAVLAQLAEYFGQARSRVAGDSLLGKAGGAMRAAGGTLPVSQVAAAHATVRTLERRFKHSAGEGGGPRFCRVCTSPGRAPSRILRCAQHLGAATIH